MMTSALIFLEQNNFRQKHLDACSLSVFDFKKPSFEFACKGGTTCDPYGTNSSTKKVCRVGGYPLPPLRTDVGVADTAFFKKMNIFIEWIIRLFFEWMNSLNEYFWFSFEWINSLNEYFRRTIEWIIEWIRKVRYSYEKWTKSAFFGRNGPLLPVFHCFLKLWFVFQFEWIILLNEYFWLNLNE